MAALPQQLEEVPSHRIGDFCCAKARDLMHRKERQSQQPHHCLASYNLGNAVPVAPAPGEATTVLDAPWVRQRVAGGTDSNDGETSAATQER